MMCYVLSFSLSDRPHHGTQSAQIHSNSESSSRFQVFFFLILLAPPPHSVLGWEGPKGLLGELLEMWRSFETPGYPVEFCRQSSSCCHSNSGLGISTWETLEVSYRVYTRVLLKYIYGIDTFVPQFATTFRGTHIILTRDLIFEVLHVPRVAHPNYPGCERLQIVFRDEPFSHFCETPSTWGGKLNTPCSGFSKGLRFLNMVMNFTLTPLSHYKPITEPRACFLLSLLLDLSIDFPSHFITSILDVHLDTSTRDKLIFPFSITRILTHFHILIPSSPFFTTMGAISTGSVQRSEAQLWPK